MTSNGLRHLRLGHPTPRVVDKLEVVGHASAPKELLRHGDGQSRAVLSTALIDRLTEDVEVVVVEGVSVRPVQRPGRARREGLGEPQTPEPIDPVTRHQSPLVEVLPAVEGRAQVRGEGRVPHPAGCEVGAFGDLSIRFCSQKGHVGLDGLCESLLVVKGDSDRGSESQ